MNKNTNIMRCSLCFIVLTVQLFRVCFIFLHAGINRVSGWVGGWVAGLLTILTTDRSIQTDTVLTVKKEGLYIKFQSCSHFIQEINTE